MPVRAQQQDWGEVWRPNPTYIEQLLLSSDLVSSVLPGSLIIGKEDLETLSSIIVTCTSAEGSVNPTKYLGPTWSLY